MYKVIAILLSISETLLVERKRARAKSRKYAYCMRNEEWTVQLQCSGVSLKRTCMRSREGPSLLIRFIRPIQPQKAEIHLFILLTVPFVMSPEFIIPTR